MKKNLFVTIAVFAVFVLASSALAFNGEYGRGRGGSSFKNCDMRGFAGLNLTDEQTVKIRGLNDAHWKDIKPLHDKMFAKRGDLKSLWLQKNPDEKKINAANREIRALRDQMEDKRVSHRLAVYKVLTPEQQAKFQANHKGRGFGHISPGHGGRGPRGGQGPMMRCP